MKTILDHKHIALVAHDNKKSDLLEWARFNRGTLAIPFSRPARLGLSCPRNWIYESPALNPGL